MLRDIHKMASVHFVDTRTPWEIKYNIRPRIPPPREQWEIDHDKAVEELIPYVRANYTHPTKGGFGQLEEADLKTLANRMVYMTDEERVDFLYEVSHSQVNTYFK